MIVKMKKLTLLCLAQEKARALKVLRRFGQVHVDHIQRPEGHDLDTLRMRLAKIDRLLERLPQTDSDEMCGKTADEVVSRIDEVFDRKRRMEDTIENIRRQRADIEPFGNFDPLMARELANHDIFGGLFKTKGKEPVPDIADAVVKVFAERKGVKYFAVISRHEVHVEAERIRLPDMSLAEMDSWLDRAGKELEECDACFERCASGRPVLEKEVQRLRDEIQYLEVSKGMASESAVAILRGWIPAENEADVGELSKANGWGYVTEDPADDEEPPTLLRNPKWVDLIKPVFGVIGVLPGYKELDVSALFLIFLSVFFAFLIGDAGYGVLFIAISLFFKGKLKGNAEAQNGLNLMVLMSACTVVWGALTGTWFGIRPEFLPAPLLGLAPDYLKGDLAGDHVMFICFTVGAIHLTIAHMWNFFRKINSLSCVGDLGWTCCTWSLYFVVLNMVVGMAYPFAPSILLTVLGTGVALIVVSLLAQKSYFGFVTLVLDVINNFVDIISYVRLFAVGAASLAVAQAFNDMAMGVGFKGAAMLGSAVILFLGHALNITLGAMGILVHGIRLNTLEFSGHAGIEWGGIKFSPFRK